MMSPATTLLFYYGLFLIIMGIVSVIFIGMNAKTALISGSMSGILAMAAGHGIHIGLGFARPAGIVVTLLLFGVFAWRSTKTLHKIFELIPTQSPELKGKGVAFLIISLMAVVSVVTSILQLVWY
jgi:hypothetical protein